LADPDRDMVYTVSCKVHKGASFDTTDQLPYIIAVYIEFYNKKVEPFV